MSAIAGRADVGFNYTSFRTRATALTMGGRHILDYLQTSSCSRVCSTSESSDRMISEVHCAHCLFWNIAIQKDTWGNSGTRLIRYNPTPGKRLIRCNPTPGKRLIRYIAAEEGLLPASIELLPRLTALQCPREVIRRRGRSWSPDDLTWHQRIAGNSIWRDADDPQRAARSWHCAITLQPSDVSAKE